MLHSINRLRSVVPVVLCAAVMAGAAGCERRTAPAPSNAPIAAGVPVAPPIDWEKTKPADATASMEGLSAVCRMLDVRNRGAQIGTSFTIGYTGHGADDGAGGKVALSPEQWKGMLELISKSPSGIGAARALPASAKNYNDGHGAVRRNAYEIRRSGAAQFVFTIVRRLDDDSTG